jgi:hypothetical protein
VKPQKLSARQIARWSRETAGNLSAIESSAPDLALVNDWIDDGRKGVDYSAVRRGGAAGTGPEMAAMSGREDDVGRLAREFMGTLERCRRDSYRLRVLTRKLVADWDAEDAPGSGQSRREAAAGVARRSNAAGTSSDSCGNCARTVAGTDRDRLRSGRCKQCFDYRSAHNGNERPSELWDGQCGATKWSHGVDFECGWPLGHDQVSDDDHGWVEVGEVA